MAMNNIRRLFSYIKQTLRPWKIEILNAKLPPDPAIRLTGPTPQIDETPNSAYFGLQSIVRGCDSQPHPCPLISVLIVRYDEDVRVITAFMADGEPAFVSTRAVGFKKVSR